MMPWNDAISPNSPSHTSMCSQPLSLPTISFIACGNGSLILDSFVQSPTPPANSITPSASTVSVRIPPIKAFGMVRCGSFASSAAIDAPSMARKNQIAKGIAAKIPENAAGLNVSLPAQPPCIKFDISKPGATTPINTSNSKIASSVTSNSKVAAMLTPRMLSTIKTI